VSGASGSTPLTGAAEPDLAAYGGKVAEAIRLFIDLYQPTPVQEGLIKQMQAFHRSCAGIRGIPLPGRSLSAPSQAGKSRTITECVRRVNAIVPAHRNRMLHIQLTERITIKMLYQRILKEIGDPEAFGRYSLEILRQRCAELLPQMGVELMAVDEIQLIGKATNGNYEVADALKALLDQGVVGILFSGNEKAGEIFEVNPQLRGRLGAPLELPPTNPKATDEVRSLRDFLGALDTRIAATGLVGRSGLRRPATVRKLGKSGGGHIGRICRIVAAALEHACSRGADVIEDFDLSFAVAHLAVPAAWCAANPYADPAQ
jgi:hypothetical protein